MSFGLVILAVMLGAAGALLCAGAAVLMAWSLVHPPRMTDGKAMWVLGRLSPGDLGLGFEDLKVRVRDERGKPLDLAAWWIPHPQANGRCAVLIHGYADAKVGAIAWAPMWHALGFNVLVPDMRGHGESGGNMCTAGYFERHDLSQLIDEVRAVKQADARSVVLFGLSMGGAVALASTAEREDIAAVVVDSVYAGFRQAAMRHMDRIGLPGRWLQSMAITLAGRICGADFDAVRPVDLIAKLRCPVMVIEAGNDWSLSDEDRAALREAVEKHMEDYGTTEIWTVPGIGHLMALVADSKVYRDKVGQFVSNALAGNAAVAPVQS